eukprot:SM000059S18697  [mRNA]  locus=s59:420205:420679:- [translate_table: standard]
MPVPCERCGAQGAEECRWCAGTGFFILGSKMLCDVEARSSRCVICHGEGVVQCDGCKGTGFRARWMGRPSPTPRNGGLSPTR